MYVVHQKFDHSNKGKEYLDKNKLVLMCGFYVYCDLIIAPKASRSILTLKKKVTIKSTPFKQKLQFQYK